MKTLLALLFFTFVFMPQMARAACTTVTYTYCAGTCNQCNTVWTQDARYPKRVTTLPMDFDYRQNDIITGNDVCGSTDCGTKNCNAGVTSASNNLLTFHGNAACTLEQGPNVLPNRLNCRYKDGYCSEYCSRWETGSYDVCD